MKLFIGMLGWGVVGFACDGWAMWALGMLGCLLIEISNIFVDE